MSLKRGAVNGGWLAGLAGLTGLAGLAGGAGSEEPIGWSHGPARFTGCRPEFLTGWASVLPEEESTVDCRWAAGGSGGGSELAGFAFGSGLAGVRLEEPAAGLTRLTRGAGGTRLIERDEAELRLERLAAHLRGIRITRGNRLSRPTLAEEPIGWGSRSARFTGRGPVGRSRLLTVLTEEEVAVDGRWAAGFTGGRSERAGFSFGSGLTGSGLEEPATGLARLTRLTGGSGLIERDETELSREVVS